MSLFTDASRVTAIGTKLPIPAAEMSERSWQRCPPSWRGTDPLSALKKHFGAAQQPLD